MSDHLAEFLASHREQAYSLFQHFNSLGRPFLLRSDLTDGLRAYCAANGDGDLADSPLGRTIGAAQEAVLDPPWVVLAVRPAIGRWQYLRFHAESADVEEIPVSEFLAFKERRVRGGASDDWPLEIDLTPFNRGFPRLRESRSVGQGMQFLNRRLSSEMFQNLDSGDQTLLEFLRVHHVRGMQLMLNRRVRDVTELRRAVRKAEEFLAAQPQDAGWDDVSERMAGLGFEPGWGKTVARMRNMLRLLSDILEAPSPQVFEEFVSRIPMIFSIVVLSPHGYFGQANVLGKPDTGGQVVYILDQVRALEKEMHHRMEEQGIEVEPRILVVTRLIPEAGNTTCNQRLEHITGTTHARILRVPFRDRVGEIVPHWISRFEIWPYLEQFAIEAEKEVLAELGGRPALLIGNYSDGNLVASLMSRRMQVTQCNIAHALEKTKYLYSDLYWRENDDRYHFSCQFTADLIAMNTADFIVTSTYQEIAGTPDSVGQYESYSSFTMPGLYRVVNGVDVYDPKFNVVSPGADPDIYFAYTQKKRRTKRMRSEAEAVIFGDGNGSPTRGRFEDSGKPIVFTMARLDRIKNINGLVDWYGRCPRLRERANLLIVGGHIDPNLSLDNEERDQILTLHRLIDEHRLEGQIRWVGFQSNRRLVGALYRRVADTRGVFVQPALFEAFGLSVIEAMTSGLPTFATRYGGPLEIIEDDVSGSHIDPNHGDQAAQKIADFLDRAAADPKEWERISSGAMKRIETRYTWQLYGQRMMTLARIYGFWKYVTNLERQETRRYLEMLYALQFRGLADGVPH
jgi:sucrose synthase